MSLKIVSFGLIICLCYFETEARVAENSSIDSVPSCYNQYSKYWIEGLQAESNKAIPNYCSLLWWCQPNGIETTPVQYNCTSVNNGTTPYFDVRTGECVQTNDHCGGSYISTNTSREYKASGVDETCRGWGEDKTYYSEIFPNLDNLNLYWQCVPNYTEGDSMFRTIAVSKPCSPGLIFSIENNCNCDWPGDDSKTEAIREYNKHPANRFKCAVLLNDTALESCHDEQGRYYVGRIPSNSSRRNYWECERQGEAPVSKPSFQSCHAGQVFNISSCNCSPEDDYFEYDAPNESTDRFKCATKIEDCGDGEPPTCYDDSERYYLGVIPHTKECSKYYMCDWNPTPGGSPLVIPQPRQCQKGLIFNVNSPFCGCDYPENSRCFANSDDKFKCASPGYTMESP